MGDFFSFLGVLLNHWVELMSGGIIMVALALIERHKTQNVSWRWYIRLIVLFVFIACFLAWRDEHKAVGDMEAKVKELNQSNDELKHSLTYEREQNKPKFKGDILQFASGYSPELDGVQVFVLLRVVNTGAPSVLGERLPIKVKAGGLEFDDVLPTDIPPGYELRGEDGSVVARFAGEELLIRKLEKQIERGGRVEGWLRYIFKNVKNEQVVRVGAQFTVSFTDVLDQPYEATYVIKPGVPNNRPMFSPGGGGAPFKRVPPNPIVTPLP